MVRLSCAQCQRAFERKASHVNRSRSVGAPLYCSQECTGLARRLKNPPSDAERKAAKKAYDAVYRVRDPAALKAKKAEYYQRTRDPEKEAAIRKARMHLHVEYCQRPEYKAWKSEYDAQRRYSIYGPFADAYRLLLDVDREVMSRASDYDIRLLNGTINKRLQRKREYERLVGSQSENCLVGNPPGDQERKDATQPRRCNRRTSA